MFSAHASNESAILFGSGRTFGSPIAGRRFTVSECKHQDDTTHCSVNRAED